jgi:hypothetical protein
MKVIGKLNGENGYSSRTASWTEGEMRRASEATMTGRTGGLESEGGSQGLLLPLLPGERMSPSIAPARESLTGVQWR